MRTRLVTLLVTALLLAGCGPASEPAAESARGPTPGADRTAPTTPAASRPASTAPVSRAKAGHVLRELAPLRGHRVVAYCLNGSTDDCTLPTRLRWSQYAEWRGRPLRPGDARSTYLVAVLAHPDAAASRELLSTVRRRSPAGPVRRAARRQDDGTVRYGERGAATLREVRHGRWHGVTSVGRVALLQPGAAPLRDVVTVDTALRRGRWSIQVIGMLRSRPGEPDPAITLDLVAQRVLDGLDQEYASLLDPSGEGA